jgi:hypothetical protein
VRDRLAAAAEVRVRIVPHKERPLRRVAVHARLPLLVVVTRAEQIEQLLPPVEQPSNVLDDLGGLPSDETHNPPGLRDVPAVAR